MKGELNSLKTLTMDDTSSKVLLCSLLCSSTSTSTCCCREKNAVSVVGFLTQLQSY